MTSPLEPDGKGSAQRDGRPDRHLPSVFPPWPFVALVFVAIGMGIIFTIISAREARQVMKRTMLSQAMMIVESIDQERFARLTATPADERSPDYHFLRDMLVRIRAANPAYQYLYLMGKRGDAPPFFFMGSAPAGTAEYSPPGQPYPEEAPALARIFLTRKPVISDPVTDRWGTWISVLVPLRDRHTGRMLAVFGMDRDAKEWLVSIRLRAILPGMLTLAIVFLVLLLFFVLRNRQRSRVTRLLTEQNRLLEMQAVELKQASEEQRRQYGELAAMRDLLQKNQEQLEEMAGTVPGVVYQFVPQPGGKMELPYVSPRALEVLGIPSTTGDFFERFMEHVDPRDRDAFLQSVLDSVQAGRPWHFEGRFTKPSGEGIWFEGISRPVRYETRLVYNGILLDITERRRAEAALRDSEEKLSATLRSIDDAVISCDLDGNVSSLNPVAEALTGWTAAAAAGRPVGEVFRIINSRTREEAENPVLRALKEGNTVDLANHTALVSRNGREYQIADSCAPIRNADGAVTGAVLVFRDVSEEYRQREELNRTRILLDAAFEQSPVPMVLATVPDMTLRYVNNAAADFLGIAAEEYRMRSLLEVPITWKELKTDGSEWGLDEQMTALPLPRALGGLETKNLELPIKLADGRIKWEIVNGAPVRDREGNLIAGLLVIQDITERKRAEEEKEKLQAQLVQSQKMESVGRLAGGVAHDFNNMLGVILGHAEMALERIGRDQPLHSDLEEIRKAAERSADFTRQLLAFARRQTVAPRALDLNATVEGMLRMLRRLIGEGIELAWRPGNDPGPVFIDPSQLDQILTNLCVNARDAITDTGTVTIETGRVSLKKADCAAHPGSVPGEYVLLTVSDDGCGMDPGTLSRLFEPYFTTKEMGKGTGLGLATLHGIVKQNNGVITVTSEVGRGTTFRIFLPRHEAQADPRGEPGQEPVPTPASGNETILLVEDEPAILEITAMMLKSHGYAVIAAGTPGEAIRLAREHRGRIDLVMTDVVMPGMNGRDLARRLMSICPGIKRLFMSGYTADVIAHQGVLDEGVHFIQKPFSKQDLAYKIREALGFG